MNHFLALLMGQIASVLSFYTDGFGIEQPMKIDMPLKKLTKLKPRKRQVGAKLEIGY